jgi:ferredoxin
MMSTEIYYFSGTGNSLRVARELQKRLPETTLLPVVGLLRNENIKTKAETVGFVFPIHCHTVPRVVKEFIRKLDVSSTRYIFAAATTAGTQCRAFREIDKVLRSKKKRLDARFVLQMPHNMPFYIEYPKLTAPKEVARMDNEAQKRLETIPSRILAHEIIEQDDPQFLAPFPAILLPFMRLLIPMNRWIVKGFTVFYANAKCTGCGTCERVCLSGRIKIIQQKPVWQKEVGCYQCQACINYCPVQAVQQKSAWFMKSYSEVNERRHDSTVSVTDIAGQKIR